MDAIIYEIFNIQSDFARHNKLLRKGTSGQSGASD